MNKQTVKGYFVSLLSCFAYRNLIRSRYMSERIAFVLVLPYRGAFSGQLHHQSEEDGVNWVMIKSTSYVGSGYLALDGSFHYFTDSGISVLEAHEFVIDERGCL